MGFGLVDAAHFNAVDQQDVGGLRNALRHHTEALAT